jgi:N-acylglucosamine-6-phosphate 2-epimerase
MNRIGLEEQLRGRLIVSCQAEPGSPLDQPTIIAALARSAELGGAAALRVEGPASIKAVRAAVRIPVIGIVKRRFPGSDVYITATVEDALAVIGAGADLMAVDATSRTRPKDTDLADIMRVALAREIPVVADVDDEQAAMAAIDAGATFVATTLSGYAGGPTPTGPDIDLVRRLAQRTRSPIVAEGRFQTPQEVHDAFEAGAHAVVIGKAITDPIWLTRMFAASTRRGPTGPGPGVEGGS